MKRLRAEHRQLAMCLVGDDLYGHEPLIAELQRLRLRFVLVAKPRSHPAPFAQIAEREQRPDGTVGYHTSWVTDFTVTPETVAPLTGIGRSRWKIENEQCNVQKNHGYELEHHYGHGQQTLSMVFYLLNLLAFLAHQLVEFGDRLYQQCRVEESRRGLGTLFRSAFYLLTFDPWEALLRYHLRERAAGP